MVFTVLGAVAELERSLIVERVKAGLRNARAKGKRLGRPRTILDAKRIATLRAQGVGWKRIVAGLGVGATVIYFFSTDLNHFLRLRKAGFLRPDSPAINVRWACK
jgi:DNA invertase Pin-like site-specific DNA recombinase